MATETNTQDSRPGERHEGLIEKHHKSPIHCAAPYRVHTGYAFAAVIALACRVSIVRFHIGRRSIPKLSGSAVNMQEQVSSGIDSSQRPGRSSTASTESESVFDNAGRVENVDFKLLQNVLTWVCKPCCRAEEWRCIKMCSVLATFRC